MNNYKEKVVIFDCDGVMFDSRVANENYYNSILSHFNLPPMTPDQIEYVHMHTADESIDFIFEGTGFIDDAREFKSRVDYSPFIKDMIIEPGLKDLLKELKPEYGLAIATNRSNTIGEVLKRNNLHDCFDVVVSSIDVIKPKPDPESIIKILDFFNVGPRQSFYIGDSLVDYHTARAAGVIFIAYKNPHLDSDYHVNSMTGLSGFFNSLEWSKLISKQKE
jgi:phosphoglycolate phosphatase